MERDYTGTGVKTREIFQCLRDSETPKGALGLSVGVHAVVLLVLLLAPMIAPQALNLKYRTVILTPRRDPPDPAKPMPLKLPPKPALRTPPSIEDPAFEPLPVKPTPEPVARAAEVRIAEEVAKLPASAAAPPWPPVPVAAPPSTPEPALPRPPQPVVVTNLFSTAVASFVPTMATNRNPEAAGFGDVKAPHQPGGRGIAGGTGRLSGFDVSSGGNDRRGSGPGSVMPAGFAAAAEAPRPSVPGPAKTVEPKDEKPVEILYKPRPDYTDEARKMRIEGEVLLRVLFTASGEVRVLEILRGLGHGLNENATGAAAQIRFRPAQRAGQATDSTAIVHIVFQLAY